MLYKGYRAAEAATAGIAGDRAAVESGTFSYYNAAERQWVFAPQGAPESPAACFSHPRVGFATQSADGYLFAAAYGCRKPPDVRRFYAEKQLISANIAVTSKIIVIFAENNSTGTSGESAARPAAPKKTDRQTAAEARMPRVRGLHIAKLLN